MVEQDRSAIFDTRACTLDNYRGRLFSVESPSTTGHCVLVYSPYVLLYGPGPTVKGKTKISRGLNTPAPGLA